MSLTKLLTFLFYLLFSSKTVKSIDLITQLIKMRKNVDFLNSKFIKPKKKINKKSNRNSSKICIVLYFVIFFQKCRPSKCCCISIIIIIVFIVAITTSNAATNQWRNQWTTRMSILSSHIFMLLLVETAFSR